ncbi:rotatin-like isoform X2 [Paramacrobiotus metropolitanus]|nr:rotatin-like isoform X2 [Paramacrobiotus metropolitanus]
METPEETLELQLRQLTFPVYLCAVIECCLNTLGETLPLGIARPLLLLDLTCRLLRVVVHPSLWVSQSPSSLKVAENVLHSLKAAGNRILYHATQTERGMHHVQKSRLIYVGLVKAVCILLDIVSLSHVDVFPPPFRSCIPWICQDESLGLSYPAIRGKCLRYLEALNPISCDVYVSAVDVCSAMTATCDFLRGFDSKCPSAFPSLAQRALKGIPSLVFHQSNHFIETCFQLCSAALGALPEKSRPFMKLVVRLLAYPNTGVRKQIYESLFNFCAGILNVDSAADPNRAPGQEVIFLLSTEVLREVVLYGLFQQETRLSAQNILSLLSQKLLIRNNAVWNRLKTVARTLFCGLFVHADLDSDFGRRIISWAQSQPDDEALFDSVTRLRAAFVLMFHPNRLVRGQGAELILKRIKTTAYLRLHGDTLKPDVQHSFDDLHVEEPFSTESLERSMTIWTDTRMDMTVRWPALRQIFLHLRKPEAHPAFYGMHGPDTLVSMLRLILERTELNYTPENLVLLLETVLTVLLYNDKWRTENAAITHIYEYILCVLSLIPVGTPMWNQLQCAGSSIIFLLTFSDMIIRRDGSLSICCTFYRAVLNPCNMMFHDFHQKQSQVGSSCDLLRSPVAEMLVIHWNVSLAGGVTSLLTEEKDVWNVDFAPRLTIDDRTKLVLRTTHPMWGFVAAARMLESAGSHGAAMEALDAMKVYQILWSFLPMTQQTELPHSVESAFRYISVLPHNSSDLLLLSRIADFVAVSAQKHSRAGRSSPAACWIHSLIVDSRSMFVEAVRKSNKELTLLATGKTSLRVPYIAACKALMKSAWNLFEHVSSVVGSDEWDMAQVLEVFIETLRGTLNSPVQDFGALVASEKCVALFCSNPLVAKQPESISFVPSVICCLSTITQNNSEPSVSFLGRAIVRSAALALLNLACYQLEYNMFPAMLESWRSQDENFLWILPLFAHRDPVVRAAALSTAAALCSFREGRVAMINAVKFVPGGLWNTALSFVFSEDEPDLVKYSAIRLLTVLLQLDAKRSDLVLLDDESNVELEGNDALFSMLDRLDFYQMIFRLLQKFGGAIHSRTPGEYLVGAVFNLCATILRRLGKRCLVKFQETQFFHAALHVCFLARKFVEDSPKIVDRVGVFCDLYALIIVAAGLEEIVTNVVAENMHTVSAAFTLLSTPAPVSHTLWLNIYTALSICLRNPSVKEAGWKYIEDQHTALLHNSKYILSLATVEPDHQRLQIAYLTFVESLTERDQPEVDDFLWRGTETIGSLVTSFLVGQFAQPAAWEVAGWSELLKRLLLRYDAVRRVAMDSGLVETVIDALLEMDSTVSKDLHVHSRNVLKSRMTEPVKTCLELLMNLLFGNVEAKRLAVKKGLASVLISLWITIVCDVESLHIIFLRLLCTFGAACQESLASFVKESDHCHTMPLTLFHVIITDLEEQLAQPLPHPDITPLLFDLLAQMSLNPQCRVFIRKSISIHRALPAPTTTPRRPKASQVLDAMWLHVLANLSFFDDGLLLILAKEDICSILFDYLEVDGLFKEVYISAMLILRNVTFCRKGMIRLTGARGVLARLLRLSSLHSEPKVRVYALSCLLEVLHDQVKLRHAAKAICFDELYHARADDEPQMFQLRARVLACLDDRPGASYEER